MPRRAPGSFARRSSRLLVIAGLAAFGLSAAPTRIESRRAEGERPPEGEPRPAPALARVPLLTGMLEIHVAHSLGRDEARRRMEKLIRYWERYGIRGDWDGDSARLLGSPLGVVVSADLHVADASIDAIVNDPGPLLRDHAIGYVRWKAERYLDPETPLEALP